MWKSIEGIALASVLALAFAVGIGAAQAAPQALALIQTDGKIELTCADGKCSAEFTSFCLQSDRFSPRAGTRYNLVGAGDVQLHGITKDGSEITLDAAKYLSFESVRTHLAVRVSVPQAEMERLGLVRVAVAVGKNASLAPEPVPGDPDPLTEQDILIASGNLRQLGSTIVDGNAGRMAAARITGRLINRLPRRGIPDMSDLQDLWRGALSKSKGAGDSERAAKMARDGLEFCEFAVRRSVLGSMRRCLQTQHDAFINFLNAEYWKAVGAGS